MATARAVIGEAMRALRATAPGDDPTVDELTVGLEAVQALILERHEARGPLWEVDVSADYVAGEDQRVRIAPGAVVNVTLPNAVVRFLSLRPEDYDFGGGVLAPPAGLTGAADNVRTRAPADGARVEIVGTNPALYVYRADLNQWIAATGLTLDTELPVGNRLTGPFTALLAERLADVVSNAPSPSSTLLRRIASARVAMASQIGRARTRRVGDYF